MGIQTCYFLMPDEVVAAGSGHSGEGRSGSNFGEAGSNFCKVGPTKMCRETRHKLPFMDECQHRALQAG